MVAGIGVSYGYQNLCRTGGEVYLCHRVNIVSKLKLPARLWAELDILPILVETKGATADERACAAVRKALPFIVQGSMGSTARIFVGFRHRVEVDADYRIHMTDLDDYERATPKEIFHQLLVQAGKVKELGLKVNFFNSTPQGGGVATMRHALLRLFGLLEMPIGWYVARPKPEVFEITKKKMHNVLQGVAPDSVVLTDDEKRIYESWCRTNVERDWAQGPYVDSDIIVVDDPQRTHSLSKQIWMDSFH